MTNGFIQVLPDDLADEGGAAEYGLTTAWGEYVDPVTGPHDVIEVRGAVVDLERFMVDFDLMDGYPIQR